MDELFATQRRRTLLAALVVVFLLAFGLASVARAEDEVTRPMSTMSVQGVDR